MFPVPLPILHSCNSSYNVRVCSTAGLVRRPRVVESGYFSVDSPVFGGFNSPSSSGIWSFVCLLQLRRFVFPVSGKSTTWLKRLSHVNSHAEIPFVTFPECFHFRRATGNHPKYQSCMFDGGPCCTCLSHCIFYTDWLSDVWDAAGAMQQAAVKQMSHKRARKLVSSISEPARSDIKCKDDEMAREPSRALIRASDWSGRGPLGVRAWVEHSSLSPSLKGHPSIDRVRVEHCTLSQGPKRDGPQVEHSSSSLSPSRHETCVERERSTSPPHKECRMERSCSPSLLTYQLQQSAAAAVCRGRHAAWLRRGWVIWWCYQIWRISQGIFCFKPGTGWGRVVGIAASSWAPPCPESWSANEVSFGFKNARVMPCQLGKDGRVSLPQGDFSYQDNVRSRKWSRSHSRSTSRMEVFSRRTKKFRRSRRERRSILSRERLSDKDGSDVMVPPSCTVFIGMPFGPRKGRLTR